LGRFHNRNDTVISPASTSSRNSRLNCTIRGYAHQRPGRRRDNSWRSRLEFCLAG
jgi:hypothetical protein